jgi:hypothetical protein
MVVGEKFEMQAVGTRHEDHLLVSEAEQKYLDSRIQDLEKAATRSRWIYGAALTVSLMLFSVAYNEYFSWYRKMAEGLPAAYASGGWGGQLGLLLMKEWVESLQFDLPYVGGRFGASDAGVVGGVLLLMISFWCVLAAKRENHIVYFLIKDAFDFEFTDNARFYLHSQIVSTQLISSGRARVYSALNLNKTIGSRPQVEDGESLPSPEPEKGGGLLARFRHEVVGRFSFSYYFIFMAPVLSLLFVLGVDLKTLSEPSPFRKESANPGAEVEAVLSHVGVLRYVGTGGTSSHGPLIQAVCDADRQHVPVFDLLGWIPIYDMENCSSSALRNRVIFSMAFILLIYYMMQRAYMFQRGTESMIRHAEAAWKPPVINARRQSLRKADEDRAAASIAEPPAPADPGGQVVP